jgi:hypothetical protein
VIESYRGIAMPIITLYQGEWGQGQDLAEPVDGTLGCRCVGRDLPVEANCRYGAPDAKLNEYQPTRSSTQEFDDPALGAHVHARLFASPDIRGSAFGRCTNRGHNRVTGRVNENSKEIVVSLVHQMPGVTQVNTDVFRSCLRLF